MPDQANEVKRSAQLTKSGKRTRRVSGDGWVYKDGEQWRYKLAVGVDPATGKIKYRGGRAASHADAAQKLRELQTGLQRGLLTAPGRITLGTYLSDWAEHVIKPNRAPATYRQYRWIIDAHIIPHLGTKRVETLKRMDIQKLITLKSTQTVQRDPQKRLSRTVLRLIRSVLHTALNEAVRDSLIAVNPASHIELPKEVKKAPGSLREDQARALLAAASASDLSAFWHFLLLTGARLAEASGLRWQDVDLTAGTARIAGQLLRQGGKLTYIPGTKTNRVRDLQLAPSLVDQLRDLKAKALVEGAADPDGLVFLNPYGRRLDQKYVGYRLRELCLAAGVPVISPHKARHTAATLALGATGDLHAVQKMLGHAQVSLTADLYGHGTAEAQRRVANALEELLNPPTPPK